VREYWWISVVLAMALIGIIRGVTDISLAIIIFGILCIAAFLFTWRKESRKDAQRDRQVEQWQEDIADRVSDKRQEQG
jgi:ABC-type transport system involved in cytochrome bd biosynthesis fused ATPase/permease subunit